MAGVSSPNEGALVNGRLVMAGFDLMGLFKTVSPVAIFTNVRALADQSLARASSTVKTGVAQVSAFIRSLVHSSLVFAAKTRLNVEVTSRLSLGVPNRF